MSVTDGLSGVLVVCHPSTGGWSVGVELARLNLFTLCWVALRLTQPTPFSLTDD
ncbi:hypothetical protein [Trichothermofontia sp.]